MSSLNPVTGNLEPGEVLFLPMQWAAAATTEDALPGFGLRMGLVVHRAFLEMQNPVLTMNLETWATEKHRISNKCI